MAWNETHYGFLIDREVKSREGILHKPYSFGQQWTVQCIQNCLSSTYVQKCNKLDYNYSTFHSILIYYKQVPNSFLYGIRWGLYIFWFFHTWDVNLRFVVWAPYTLSLNSVESSFSKTKLSEKHRTIRNSYKTSFLLLIYSQKKNMTWKFLASSNISNALQPFVSFLNFLTWKTVYKKFSPNKYIMPVSSRSEPVVGA